MHLPRLTTRRLMAVAVVAALLLWADRLWRLSTGYQEKARWYGRAVLEIADERDAGNGPAMDHYRALRDKYEHASRYPWIPVPPDPAPPP